KPPPSGRGSALILLRRPQGANAAGARAYRRCRRKGFVARTDFLRREVAGLINAVSRAARASPAAAAAGSAPRLLLGSWLRRSRRLLTCCACKRSLTPAQRRQLELHLQDTRDAVE